MTEAKMKLLWSQVICILQGDRLFQPYLVCILICNNHTIVLLLKIPLQSLNTTANTVDFCNIFFYCSKIIRTTLFSFLTNIQNICTKMCTFISFCNIFVLFLCSGFGSLCCCTRFTKNSQISYEPQPKKKDPFCWFPWQNVCCLKCCIYLSLLQLIYIRHVLKSCKENQLIK